jgi:hypothetical protein
MTLSSHLFEYYPLNDKVDAIPINAYLVCFHELLGHAAHQEKSSNLPLSIQMNDLISSMQASIISVEGVAEYQYEKGFEFLEKEKEKLNISKTDLIYYKENHEIRMHYLAEYILFSLVYDYSIKNKDFNAYDYFLKVTKNPALTKRLIQTIKAGFVDYKNNLNYFQGRLLVQVIQKELIKVHGKTIFEDNKELFLNSLLTGVWSYEVYPRAVKFFFNYYLKNN